MAGAVDGVAGSVSACAVGDFGIGMAWIRRGRIEREAMAVLG
jgi:hypothetical protein